jgi:flagellar biosynthesis/type III secretory pathway protein FliH
MDMRQQVTELESKLKKILETQELTKQQKEMLQTAMQYGYAAAYCSRTCDMNESFFAGMRYTDEYNKMIEEVKK